MKALTVLTLFSGAAGGWDLGMQRAGYRVVAACEIDPWRRSVLQRNFPDSEVYADVREISAARLLADLGSLPDVIVGSPPCQDASTANTKGRGVDGERTGLFFEFTRLARECRPLWCCAENVPGIRARGIDRVLAELEEAGYACWPLVVGAVHAGAPHRRNRVWVVCTRADAYGHWQHGLAEHGEVGGLEGDGGAAADADRAGRQAQPSAQRRTLEQAEGEAPQRDGVAAWDSWNDGYAARAGRVDDGLPKGVARAALAAYGDAVVPQITEAIGRTMTRLLTLEAAQ